jgi:hypothetical protein
MIGARSFSICRCVLIAASISSVNLALQVTSTQF